MEGIRIRGERGALRAFSLMLLVLASLLVLSPAARAADARALFLTEQVRPGAVRGPILGPVQPNLLVAQPGEEEGFVLAFRPDATAYVDAVVDPTSAPFTKQWAQVLRTEWVEITRPSSGTGARPGRYADPLPPQVPGAGNAGKLLARAGEWSSFVVLVSVPATATAGTHAGTVNVRDAAGTVIASVRFSITIVPTKAASGALDPAIAPHDARNFKVLFNFNPNWYRALAPADTAQAQYEQTYRTLWMLARHRASSTQWQKAYPSGDGTYGCSAADGYLKVFDDMPWWADGKAGALPVALMPNNTVARCTQDGFAIKDDASPASKFDDRIGDPVKSAWFLYRVADHWRKQGIQDHRAYFLNPFDEPDARQNATVVPQVNQMVHDYAPGVKVLGTTWPKEVRNERVCRTLRGVRRCATRVAQTESNVSLRDGGKDDLDGWIVPYFRLFGFGASANQRLAGVNRSREVISRLQSIQARGGEAWSYDLPLGTRRIPGLAIDGAATDSRVMFWPLGREHVNGWFIAVSNRWVDPTNVAKTRNPWDAPLSWVGAGSFDRENTGPHGVVSNGWGSLYYPGVRPQLGLRDPLGQPVSSLRLERMRDGVEDVNLMTQYRARFGQAALNRKLAGVLGPLVTSTDLPGNEAFPRISNIGLALRMEIVRRQLLAELAQ
jgi:hypothetical protein